MALPIDNRGTVTRTSRIVRNVPLLLNDAVEHSCRSGFCESGHARAIGPVCESHARHIAPGRRDEIRRLLNLMRCGGIRCVKRDFQIRPVCFEACDYQRPGGCGPHQPCGLQEYPLGAGRVLISNRLRIGDCQRLTRSAGIIRDGVQGLIIGSPSVLGVGKVRRRSVQQVSLQCGSTAFAATTIQVERPRGRVRRSR